MSAVDDVLAAVDRRVEELLRRRRRVSSFGTVVAVGPPVEVEVRGDVVARPVRVAASVGSVSSGDVVGMLRFGSRWYVVAVLSEGS